ncbi:MAG: D-cysteine desulfhydrase family protein [Anaerolineales bacterium]|nr:D-cysteine desulfhydrase family protein [Anaerolineales bacterium]
MSPRLKIAHLPTVIEVLPRLSKTLGGPRLLVKRDDQTGLAFGGNKTRKLEFLLAEAQEQGAHTVITAGALQSNHCRQTAAAAARVGLDCILVLVGQPPDQPTGNLLLNQLLGADFVWVDRVEQRDDALQETYAAALEKGRHPYLVPYGGSNPTGALAYVFAMQEMLEQIEPPDWIVFASSSGGTQAGLVLGANRFNFQGQVLGISIDEPQDVLRARVAALATAASEKIGEKIAISPDEVLVNDDFCQPGYGVLTEVEREAVQMFARSEGMLLDPVYTGRAAGGLISLIRQGFFKPDQTVLFWNTGGQPALFSDKYCSVIR